MRSSTPASLTFLAGLVSLAAQLRLAPMEPNRAPANHVKE